MHYIDLIKTDLIKTDSILTKRRLTWAMPVLLSLPYIPTSHGAALEEIIVTAQKKAQSLQDVPISVSALSANDVAGLRLNNASDISAQIPNLQISTAYGDVQPIFSIRGVSMSDYSPNQTSPIGVYVDEVYIGAPYLQGLTLFDTERAEVLRGPQGTLYGKNATGGAINIITKTPSYDETLGSLSLTAGNYSQKKIDAAVETPLITDTLAVRAALTRHQADEYYSNHAANAADLSGTDYYAGRLTFSYQANDDLELIFRVNSGNSDATSKGGVSEGRLAGGVNVLGYSRPNNYDAFEGDINRVGQTTAAH
jgi:iron complex outermembrane recepter protein